MDTSQDEPPQVATSNTVNRLAAVLSGGLIALVLVVGGYAIWGVDRLPTLTPALFDEARQKWHAEPLTDYVIEIEVSGPQASTYRVEMAKGKAVSATRNGQPLKNQRTFRTWSVSGMFEMTMAPDVERLRKHEKSGAGAPPLALWAKFDKRYGYPLRYRRAGWGSSRSVAVGQVSNSQTADVSWVVTHFEVK